MHLFRLLFHFPFCHESLLKCLFDWNRPCCSHTSLFVALHPTITSHFLSLSFCSSVAELEHVWHPSSSPLLSPTCILFLSIDIKWKKPPHTSSLRLCLFVSCWLQTGEVEVFCTGRYSALSPSFNFWIIGRGPATLSSIIGSFVCKGVCCCVWIKVWVCVQTKAKGNLYYWPL